MLIMIDNYDSFTYNLVQYLQMLDTEVKVLRNDACTVDDIIAAAPAQIVISPGPGSPPDAGISMEVIKRLSGSIPILGVCLGHQCIGAAFGAKVIKARRLMHGKVSKVAHNGEGIFKNMKSPLSAIRYHSLALAREGFPDCLEITASSEEENEIMALRHREHLTVGVQFHPESILTASGKRLLRNFLRMTMEK
ncbi:MAG: aminodeoxychorismate/anthranilate synthase component II [Lentisphaeria bacterium]